MSLEKAESPKYRLTYYPLRGRGELLRILFAHLQINYEDVRISPEEWAKRKQDSPFGVLPIMEFLDSGKKLSSSIGLARYIAETYGLAGSSAIENLELFSIVDAANDAWVHIYDAIFWEKDESRKAKLTKILHEDYLPKQIAKFERRAAANNTKEGWMFGEKLTYADIATYLLFEYVVNNIPNSATQYPTLARLMESVLSQERIASWIKERPVTPL